MPDLPAKPRACGAKFHDFFGAHLLGRLSSNGSVVEKKIAWFRLPIGQFRAQIGQFRDVFGRFRAAIGHYRAVSGDIGAMRRCEGVAGTLPSRPFRQTMTPD
jgi:hypothetical protein